MKAAILAAVVALTIPAASSAANLPHPSLDAAATQVAGHPVTVYCEMDWYPWIKAFEAQGVNGTSVAGFTVIGTPIIYLSPRACETLQALLRGFPVGVYEVSSAMLTLVHESVHQRGIPDEGLTDCTALPLLPEIATGFFNVPVTITESYLTTVRQRVVFRIRGKRVVRFYPRQVVRSRTVPNPWLVELASNALAWHRSKPPEYQGGC